MSIHTYTTEVVWTGDSGEGTRDYRSYSRNHQIKSAGKPKIEGSSDPLFRGDPSKYNPEELFLASLSSCHMLWYLHLCSDNNIIVVSYRDKPEGTMRTETFGGGCFEVVVLKPQVTIREPVKTELARELHLEARKKCFIANSCNFPIKHEPAIFISK